MIIRIEVDKIGFAKCDYLVKTYRRLPCCDNIRSRQLPFKTTTLFRNLSSLPKYNSKKILKIPISKFQKYKIPKTPSNLFKTRSSRNGRNPSWQRIINRAWTAHLPTKCQTDRGVSGSSDPPARQLPTIRSRERYQSEPHSCVPYDGLKVGLGDREEIRDCKFVIFYAEFWGGILEIFLRGVLWGEIYGVREIMYFLGWVRGRSSSANNCWFILGVKITFLN